MNKFKKFKNIIASILGIFILSVNSIEVSINAEQKYIMGDINKDSYTNTIDVLILKRHLLGLNAINNETLCFADMDNSLNIDISDLLQLKQTVLGIIEKKSTTTGWVQLNDYKQYVIGDTMLIGENNIFGETLNFGEDGSFRTGLNFIDGYYKLFDDHGYIITDWSNIPTFVNTSKALYSYDEMKQDLLSLEKTYPTLIKLNVLNTTADNRNIYCIEVGNPNAKNTIVIHASCHGREYMNTTLVMNQLEYCLQNYYSKSYGDYSYNKMLEDYKIYLIPMLNPDGVSISQFGADAIQNDDIRSGVKSILNRTGVSHTIWKSNALGVDINRNFSTSYWDTFIDYTYKPSYMKYKGDSAGSEIETQTVQNLCTSLNGLKAVISYHSTGSVIYYDYGQTGILKTNNQTLFNAVANETGYAKASQSLYGVGCSDWVIDKLKTSALTIETGFSSCPLPVSEYPAMWNKNKNVWWAIIQAL